MKSRRGHKRFFKLLITLLLLICVRTTTYADQPSSSTQGGRPAGSYSLSDFDNINLFNGNLNFRLPVLRIGGRGESGFTISYLAETRWQQSGGFVGQSPVYTNFPVGMRGIVAGFGELKDGTTTYDYVETNGILCPDDPYQPQKAIVAFNLTSADGTTYVFRPVVNSGAPIDIQPCPVHLTGTNMGREFITWDGSDMKLVADYDVYHNGNGYRMKTSPNGPTLQGGWTVLLPNGTRYRLNTDGTRWLDDRNGNRTTFTLSQSGYYYGVTQIKDSLGRVVNIDYTDLEDTKITYKGANGVPQLIHAGSNKVWMPDGRSYTLTFNTNEELTRVELPTGGAYEYDWDGVIPPSNEPGQPPPGMPYRYVTERRVYADGNNLTSKMTFTREDNYTHTMTRVDTYDGNNNLLSRTKHYFHGSATPGGANANPSWLGAADEENAQLKRGKEFLTESYAADGVTLLRKKETEWQAGRTMTWPGPYEHRYIEINRRVEFNKTTLTDVSPNLVTQTSYSYNQGVWENAPFNVLTDLYQYDYGENNPGALLTRTHTEYISHTSGNYQTQPYIMLLPTETWTSSDAGGNDKASLVKYEYDHYPATSPLVDRPNISGHNPGYGTSYTPRGNVTKVTNYANAQNQTGEVYNYSKYDIAGNVVKRTDGRGYVTTFDFSDHFGSPDGDARLNAVPSELSSTGKVSYGFPTLVTNALGQVAYTQYDFYLGVAVDSEDVNGVKTSAYYNDVLGRPTQVVRAIATDAKSQTTYDYDDAALKVTTTGDLNIYGDNLVKSEIVYDKLGRPSKSHMYEPDGTFITTATEYDAMGRVKRASNPYRAADPIVWTVSNYDALGRISKLTTSDGAEVNTYYSGSRVLVKDPAGKERMSRSNALGHVKDVWEITSADDATELITFPNRPEVTAGYLTKYEHDTLGNLKKVTQQKGTNGTAQIRSFGYNSLSQLTSVTNPESGTTSYSYDLNGNLELRTDPRLMPNDPLPNTPPDYIETSFSYDELNRLKTRTYNDGTPNVIYSYDDPSITYSKGRLTKVSSSMSETKYGEFDALGRVKQSQQSTDGQTYPQMSYTYDLAGNLKTETYPSGRVVTHSYDTAGRLNSVTGQKTGESNKTYVSDLSYKAHGAMDAMKLGNNLWEHAKFNTRLQVEEIGIGTSSTNSSVLELDYSYGTANNNGNVHSQTITAPNLTLTQTYEYDDLNRLKFAQENNGTNWKQTFTYDRFGNRRIDTAQTTLGLTSENPVLNPANNRIAPQAGELYDYDAAGNLTKDKAGNTYAYDADGRQVKYNGGASANGGATYIYDGEGKRVKKVAGVVATVFLYNAAGQLVAEYSSAAAEQNGTQYVTADTLGSPRLVTGADGSVTGRHDYRPFGEEIGAGTGGRNTVPGYTATDDLKQKFTGYERDIETGLDYAQARYFSSPQGRFTSPDPLLSSGKASRPQTWNRYTYALNNPLRFTDPSGLSPTANVTPKYQSDDHVEQQRQRERLITQEEYNEAWIERRFERASDGYLDDTVDMAASMPMATVSSSETTQDAATDTPFVISNASSLIDQVIAGTNTGYHDAEGIAQCALLPLMWENEQQGLGGKLSQTSSSRTTPNWRKGAQAAYGMPLARGTVLASGWKNGRYLSTPSGNHTVVFDKWGTEGGRQGMYVVEQVLGSYAKPRHSFKAFNDTGYFKDASAFHVVTLRTKSEFINNNLRRVLHE